MNITRFNPSVNANLHLGHLYTALVNEALSVDGKFYVRFDDTLPNDLVDYGAERMARVREHQEEDLRWLGLNVTEYISQADALEEVRKIIKPLGLSDYDGRSSTPEFIADSFICMYPAVPLITAEKVVFDHMIGINLLIRGMDLMTEYALYQYFCEKLGYEAPRHVYLPRLGWTHGNMSKQLGGLFISDLRAEGYTPDEVRSMVAKAALKWHLNGWSLLNLKGSPIL